jgi:predicted RNA-binding protein YlqC (UPF0109 family)
MAVSIDQQFIEYIVKSLVGNPDDVKIERRIDEKGVLLELSVNPDDLGRVIGKRGATAQSIRTLLRALGTKNDARYNLKIVDTGPPPAKRSSSDDSDDDQDDSAKSTAAEDQTVTDEMEAPRNDETTQADQAPGLDPAKAEDVEIPSNRPEDTEKPKEEEKEDMITRTRRELADLDDLEL